jgi:transposase
LKPGALSRASEIDRAERGLRRLPAATRTRIARELLTQIRRLNQEVDALEQELLALIRAQRPWLLEETGCGALVAAILIGRTAGTKQFKSDASFALQAGIAPIPCSSGQHRQYRLNRGGDRQLNRALHVIAVTRARVDPATQAFLERKQSEGKTSKGPCAASNDIWRAAFTICSLSTPGPASGPRMPPSPRIPTDDVRLAPSSKAPRRRRCNVLPSRAARNYRESLDIPG